MLHQSESSYSFKISLRKRLGAWARRHPRFFWLVMAAVGIVLLSAALLLFLNIATFKKAVSYAPCEVNYGERVASWDGQGDDAWDQTGYHYETKRFRVSAQAPKQLFPNVVESPANSITTGGLDGAPGCANGVTDLVDTAEGNYKWYGAIAQAARLGQPASKVSTINAEESVRIGKHSKAVSPPVSTSSHFRAAAWIDDGAQAILQSQDRSKTQLLWCQGLNQPVDANGQCGNLSQPAFGKLPLRGAGYLFTADNCPLKNCNAVDSWYNREGTQKDTDYSSLIGRNQKGELLPFYLHLAAVSTYANSMGSWMNLTFKYPNKPEITNEVTTMPKTVAAGGTFDVTMHVRKIGPNLKSLAATPKLDGQPLKEVAGFSADTADLDAINDGREAELSAKYRLTGGEAGKCYDLPIGLSSVVDAPNPDPQQQDQAYKVEVPQTASARYCIAQSNPVTTYTYEVNSRGAIQSDLNDFAAQVAQTFADVRGWVQAGVTFKRVESGGNFTLVLSSPDQMTTFSSGCDAVYSCNAGRYVIINDERWRTATPSWNNAGGSLRDYRHMVANHETGHWLGFGHLQCTAAGAPAPVMQQQSISLQGCVFNPWPTTGEIASLKARL